MDIYSFERIFREYAHLPSSTRLPCAYEHGWTPSDKPLTSDMAGPMRLVLVFSTRRATAWRQHGTKTPIVSGAPFVLHRRMHGIERAPDAHGTVAFPSHATDLVDSAFNVDSYARQLLSLPSECQPVSVCLHFEDIKRGRAALYERHGLRVVSAGNPYDNGGWVDAFYEILRHAGFTTSNAPGSYTFYSVEMGIPFFLTGESPVHVNHGNDINSPSRYTIHDYETGVATCALFARRSDHITDEQRRFVEDELGVRDAVSRPELASTLWREHERRRTYGWRGIRNRARLFVRRIGVQGPLSALLTATSAVPHMIGRLARSLPRGARDILHVQVGDGTLSDSVDKALGTHDGMLHRVAPMQTETSDGRANAGTPRPGMVIFSGSGGVDRYLAVWHSISARLSPHALVLLEANRPSPDREYFVREVLFDIADELFAPAGLRLFRLRGALDAATPQKTSAPAAVQETAS